MRNPIILLLFVVAFSWVAQAGNFFELDLRQASKLTVKGQEGVQACVQWAESPGGPWTPLTNVIVGANGMAQMDIELGDDHRFYRAMKESDPVDPAGFVWIPPGTFLMGSPPDEPNREWDETQHLVTLTRGFWMSDHEVTQAEFETVMGTNPSLFKGADLPVETVSYFDAWNYCDSLTQRERAAGRITIKQTYRLPTEAEWEYAARAGTTTALYGPLDSIAWHFGNSESKTHPVRRKIANAWGLHDMIGNVTEACYDYYAEYPTEAVVDPVGRPPRLLDNGINYRGGSFWNWDAPKSLRFAYRQGYTAFTDRYENMGFRPILISLEPNP